LDPDDIMVLDGGDEVYVWVGTGSTDEEKTKSLDMAKVIEKIEKPRRNFIDFPSGIHLDRPN
jgi:gelsolin